MTGLFRSHFREPEWHAFLAFAIFLIVLGLCFITQPLLSLPEFRPHLGRQEGLPISPETPLMHREFLPVAAPSVHAPSLAELPDGRLAAAWFAGSREGADDVRIVMSLYGRNPLEDETEAHAEADRQPQWQAPRTVANREQTIRDTHRSIRKLGNPVLFVDGQRLHLFYVSASLGGWAGSSINHRYSDDLGEHWSNATKLMTSPFLNVSTLVRTPPLKLSDGSLGLPVYHELIHKYGEWLRLSPQGDVLSKVRMAHPRATLQPAVLPLSTRKALAFLRDSGPGQGYVQVSYTEDGGQHWRPGPALNLTNPNASIAVLTLRDGRFLMAANPGEGRHLLELWIARDPLQWDKVATLDTGLPPGAVSVPPPPERTGQHPLAATDESSYPALLQSRDGMIHLAFTWHRQRIQHIRFNTAWLEQQLRQRTETLPQARTSVKKP